MRLLMVCPSVRWLEVFIVVSQSDSLQLGSVVQSEGIQASLCEPV